MAEEAEGIDGFLYDHRQAFQHYDVYYRFDPYRQTYLEPENVPAVMCFSASIVQWLEENRWIEKYSLSGKKIERFAVALRKVCEVAAENGYGLVGLGD